MQTILHKFRGLGYVQLGKSSGLPLRPTSAFLLDLIFRFEWHWRLLTFALYGSVDSDTLDGDACLLNRELSGATPTVLQLKQLLHFLVIQRVELEIVFHGRVCLLHRDVRVLLEKTIKFLEVFMRRVNVLVRGRVEDKFLGPPALFLRAVLVGARHHLRDDCDCLVAQFGTLIKADGWALYAQV